MDLNSSFPRNLAYSLKELNNFSQQSFRVMTDHLSTKINAGEIFRINLPAGFTLLDLRTIALHFNFTGSTTSTGTVGGLHAPRYSSSLIERLNIYINNNLVSTINQYNLLYNTFADLQFGQDASSKRWLENIDPSVNYSSTANAAGAYITATRACANATTSDTSKPMVINNWLGFLGGETSTPVIDCASLGQITLEFQLAPATCCWVGASSDGIVPAAVPSYYIDNVYMTGSKITFNTEEYYSLLSSKLLDGGLIIGYKDYYQTRSPLYAKGSGISFNYSVNANSLDAIICTANISAYNTLGYLELFGSQNKDVNAQIDNGGSIATLSANYTFAEALALQGIANSIVRTNNKNPSGSGDLFNQTAYFQRNMLGLTGSQFFVNSIAVDLWNKAPDYIYEEALENLGLKNIDVNCSLHPGCVSLYHFMKYYFAQVVRFNNISGDSSFWKSGMSANNSPINITYQATFDSTNTDSVYLVFFNCLTKLLSVSAGRVITVI